MTDRDRIIALERTVRELMLQIPHLPARWGESSAGSQETFRLIRGQSVGAQSGGTILIDNVDVLAGGEDPTNGNPATQVTVQNIFGQSFTDNEAVQAIYNEDLGGTDLTDWEAIKTTSGTETYRAIRGLVKGTVAADDATFVIDNVIPLAGGNDPVAGNPATEITVQQPYGPPYRETLTDNEPITAIWDGAAWELVQVERYRLIKGKATAGVSSGAGTFTIDGIDVLAGSRDPRSDSTSETETVTVRKTWGDKYLNNADVVAAHNPRTNEWDVISRGLTVEGLTIELTLETGPLLKVALLLDGEEISSDTLAFNTKVINNPTDIALDTPTSTSLEVVLPYTPVTLYTLPAATESSPVEFSDTEAGTEC